MLATLSSTSVSSEYVSIVSMIVMYLRIYCISIYLLLLIYIYSNVSVEVLILYSLMILYILKMYRCNYNHVIILFDDNISCSSISHTFSNPSNLYMNTRFSSNIFLSSFSLFILYRNHLNF